MQSIEANGFLGYVQLIYYQSIGFLGYAYLFCLYFLFAIGTDQTPDWV